MIDIDDIAHLDANARAKLATAQQAFWKNWMKPELERRSLEEYLAMPSQGHLAVLQSKGRDGYDAWIRQMEKLRKRYHRR